VILVDHAEQAQSVPGIDQAEIVEIEGGGHGFDKADARKTTDATLEFLADWSARDRRIKILSLSRNFGHQLAATAGVD